MNDWLATHPSATPEIVRAEYEGEIASLEATIERLVRDQNGAAEARRRLRTHDRWLGADERAHALQSAAALCDYIAHTTVLAETLATRLRRLRFSLENIA